MKKEIPTIEKYKRSNLTYSSKYSFYEYYNIKKLVRIMLGTGNLVR